METLPADRLMETWVFDGARAVLEERRSVAAKWRAAARTLDLARREPWTMLEGGFALLRRPGQPTCRGRCSR